jgi:hypothetical protein
VPANANVNHAEHTPPAATTKSLEAISIASSVTHQALGKSSTSPLPARADAAAVHPEPDEAAVSHFRDISEDEGGCESSGSWGINSEEADDRGFPVTPQQLQTSTGRLLDDHSHCHIMESTLLRGALQQDHMMHIYSPDTGPHPREQPTQHSATRGSAAAAVG